MPRARLEYQVRVSVMESEEAGEPAMMLGGGHAADRSWKRGGMTARSTRNLDRRVGQRKRLHRRAEGRPDRRMEDEERKSRKKARWWEYPASGPPDSPNRIAQEETQGWKEILAKFLQEHG